MKTNKKTNKVIFIILIITIIIGAFSFKFLYLSQEQEKVKFSLFEKRWLAENKNKIFDIAIPNDLPIYGNEGEGIFFSFLTDLVTKTELDFNMISYGVALEKPKTPNIFKIVKPEQEISNNDFVFYEDYYVVLGKNNLKLNKIEELNQKTIGVLTNDFSLINKYLNDYNLTFITAEGITQLITSFNEGEVDYIIIPRNMHLNHIIINNYYLVYLFNDLANKYVLTINDQEARLKTIISKYFKSWSQKQNDVKYNAEMFNLYCNLKSVKEEEKATFQGQRYVYGYISNPPYDLYKYGELNGINQVFIANFATLADIEFTYQRYDSVQALQEALNQKEVDIAFNYYNFEHLADHIFGTSAFINSEYLILAPLRNNLIIDSLVGLNNQELNLIKGSKLNDYLKGNAKAKFIVYDNLKEIEGNDNNLLAIDYNVYQYYKSRDLKKYNIIYHSAMTSNYNYLINKENALLYDFFQYYLNNINYKQYTLNGLNGLLLNYSVINLSFFWFYLILVPFLIILIIVIIIKRKKMLVSKKYQMVKHIDPLTSLKNRYYLTNNVEKWEENKIYPQTIIIIDLNNLKEINDNYGHDEGDRLIKAAANILINNQLEKTDIIRTDGDEFLIYLVGYDENAIADYIKKLEGLFKELPYERGVAIGYSMIMDEIKLIDDAINEAVLEMLTNKEIKSKNKK